MTNLPHEPIGVHLMIAECEVDGSAATVDAYLSGTTLPTTELAIGGVVPLDAGIRVAMVGTPGKLVYELVTGAWTPVRLSAGDVVAARVQLTVDTSGLEFLYGIDLDGAGKPLFDVPPTVLATALPRPATAAAMPYDNGTSGLAADDVQAAIDELAAP